MKIAVLLSVLVTLGVVVALPAPQTEQASDEEIQESVNEISRRKYGHIILGLGLLHHHSPIWSVNDVEDEEVAAFIEELHALYQPQDEDEQVKDEQIEEEGSVDEISGQQHGEFVSGLGFVSYYSPMWTAIKDLNDDELAAFLQELHGYPFTQDKVQDRENRGRRHINGNDHGEYVPGLGFVSYHNPLWSIIRLFESEELEKFIKHLHLHHHRPHPYLHHHRPDSVTEHKVEEEIRTPAEDLAVDESAYEDQAENQDDENVNKVDIGEEVERIAQNEDEDDAGEVGSGEEVERRAQNEVGEDADEDDSGKEVERRAQNEDGEDADEVGSWEEMERSAQNEDGEDADEAGSGEQVERRAQNEDGKDADEVDSGEKVERRAQNEDGEDADEVDSGEEVERRAQNEDGEDAVEVDSGEEVERRAQNEVGEDADEVDSGEDVLRID